MKKIKSTQAPEEIRKKQRRTKYSKAMPSRRSRHSRTGTIPLKKKIDIVDEGRPVVGRPEKDD